jgi:hypothetical protein
MVCILGPIAFIFAITKMPITRVQMREYFQSVEILSAINEDASPHVMNRHAMCILFCCIQHGKVELDIYFVSCDGIAPLNPFSMLWN